MNPSEWVPVQYWWLHRRCLLTFPGFRAGVVDLGGVGEGQRVARPNAGLAHGGGGGGDNPPPPPFCIRATQEDRLSRFMLALSFRGGSFPLHDKAAPHFAEGACLGEALHSGVKDGL